MENNNSVPKAEQPVNVTVEQRPRGARRLMLEHAATTCTPWLILVFACLFGMAAVLLRDGASGLGRTISVVLFYALLAPFIIGGNRKPRWQSFLLLVPVIALSASCTLFAESGISVLGVLLTVVVGMLQLIYMGNNISSADSSLPTTLRKELFIVPFGYTFANLVPSYAGLNKGKNEKKMPWKVLIGLAISIPVVIVLLALFSSADQAFANLSERILSFINDDIAHVITSVIFGGLLGLLIYPLVLTLRSGYSPERRKSEAKHWCDATVAATITFVSSAVFILFILVEIKYLFVADELPEGIGSYAEYARKGVFELCLIALLTFAAVTFFTIFAKRNEKGGIPIILKLALTLISVCTVVIVASAFYKLCCDVYVYGLTKNRVFAFVFVVFIGLCMIALIAKIWINRLRLSSVVTALAIAFLTLFACCNPDKLCADYNTSRYLNDKTDIDMAYMSTLNCSAAPAMKRLYNEASDESVKEIALGMISKYYWYGDDYVTCKDLTFGQWNIDAQNALDIWQELRPEKSAFTSLDYKYKGFYHSYIDEAPDDSFTIN